jgi:small-conductance mechanosensitive channel
MASFERLTNLLAAIFWLATTLNAFRLLGPVWDGLKTLFVSEATFGNFSVSLGGIFAFVVAIWLGVMVSRILRFVLEEDVYPRVSLPRGVPSAISSMIHYALITIAFFVALAVAGIDLSSFAIIAGAVGVGIGFGLQNIVNNFVSGLILLFERPIQAGDSIELGPLFGRVGRIGIRSSTVRTFQGAEVIVPNADLIAKEVINWTLSDAHRRLEVPVGVSYSSNPRQVIDLLVKAAHTHREVMKEPEPFAIFVGYGASSIDFELRAWVSNFGEGLRIQTELLLDIWDRLEEAGIEIPFPQQDLHLRSVDETAAAMLAGRPAARSANSAGPPEPSPDRPAQGPVDRRTPQSAAAPSSDEDAGGDATSS